MGVTAPGAVAGQGYGQGQGEDWSKRKEDELRKRARRLLEAICMLEDA